jgi:colicin import membrane protein
MSLSEAIHLRSENERKAFVATVVIFMLLLLALFLWKLSTNVREEFEGGIVVDFGTTETGLGEDNSSLGEPSSGESDIPEPVQQTVTSPVTPTPPSPSVKPVLTADNQEIALEKKKKQEEERLKKEEEQKKKLQAEAEAKAKAEAEKKKQQQEEFKKKMAEGLKGVKGAGAGGTGTGTGEGTSKPGGNQGDPNGTPGAPKGQGSGMGTGQGASGVGFSLSGRKMTVKPNPVVEGNKYGKVVIKITVDKSGNVIDASFTSGGSTTTDSYLVSLSIREAKKAKFDNAPTAADEQFGTITFTYNLGQ